MNNLRVFDNPEFGKVRTVMLDGEPWLVGKDVATVLGYSNFRDALDRHVESEDKIQSDGVVIRDSMGREQHPTIINESGLYSLVLSSKLPGAKRFRRWVTSEVLPSIRRTGAYHVGNIPAVSPNALAKLITVTCRGVREAGGSPRDAAKAASEIYQIWGIPVPIPLRTDTSGQVSLFEDSDANSDAKS